MDSMHIMKTWVDASYAVHPDMRSHTGGCISFGKGMIISKSLKQKLNTKISTEAELVGATDMLPANLWTKYFIEAQGYNLTENDFNQDNESTMKLEKNGVKVRGIYTFISSGSGTELNKKVLIFCIVQHTKWLLTNLQNHYKEKCLES